MFLVRIIHSKVSSRLHLFPMDMTLCFALASYIVERGSHDITYTILHYEVQQIARTSHYKTLR